MTTLYRIGAGHRLSTTIDGQYYVLDAGARIPAGLLAAWVASGDLVKILAAGVIVEDAGEVSPSSATSPASLKRHTSATRSALGLASRQAVG